MKRVYAPEPHAPEYYRNDDEDAWDEDYEPDYEDILRIRREDESREYTVKRSVHK